MFYVWIEKMSQKGQQSPENVMEVFFKLNIRSLIADGFKQIICRDILYDNDVAVCAFVGTFQSIIPFQLKSLRDQGST